MPPWSPIAPNPRRAAAIRGICLGLLARPRGKFTIVSTSIASSFLVASPTLTCPFFNHSLVLMVEHDVEGSFGFVVNRPSDLPVESLLDELGVPASEAATSIPVHIGGPVAPQTGWILFEREPGEALENALPLGETLGLTASLEFFRELAAREERPRALLMLGYSGWGPGQLESELKEGSWLPVDYSPELLFETPPDQRWRAALRSLGVDPAWVVGRSVPSA